MSSSNDIAADAIAAAAGESTSLAEPTPTPPLASGVIDGIYIAEEASGSMTELTEARLIAGRGIFGDRYMRRKGTYSVFRVSKKDLGQREPGRQLTIVSAEGLEAAFLTNGMKALDSLGDFRRNIVTRGIPAAVLQGAVGRELALGDEVVVFVHRVTVPCMYNERRIERPGLMEATWDVCGVSCEVVRGGNLRSGDAVRIAGGEAQMERVDEGAQSPDFFIRPSKRTRQQVNQGLLMRSAALPKLLELDPGGVARAIESFHSVGLTLFKRPKRFRRAEALQERFGIMVAIFAFLICFLLVMQHGKDWWAESGWDQRWRELVAGWQKRPAPK